MTLWGFRGPLGAFIAAWGGVAMLTSAPFDDWWHNAYGLDVKILSPPHMVLAAGIIAVHLGALILILGRMNRAQGAERARLRVLYLYVGGMILVCLTVLLMETHLPQPDAHRRTSIDVVAMVVPLVLAAVARGSGYRWAATAVAGVYSVFVLLMSWILPLFPAQPKLGPVYHQVTQFIPPEFPLLLIVPALALDLLWQRTADWGAWRQSLVFGCGFPGGVRRRAVAVRRFPDVARARNWFFGAKYFDYFTPPTSLYVRYRFFAGETGAVFWQELALALAGAILTTRLGIAAGNWMRRIQR